MTSFNSLTKRRLQVRTGPGVLERLRRALRETLVLGIHRPEARALALLAVEEAAANVLEHGYGGEPGRPLSVTVSMETDETFTITLRDRAPVVDVTRIETPDVEDLAESASPRGRGLAMVKLLARSVTHRKRRGGGNELVLVFDAADLSRRVEESLEEAG